MDQRPGETTGDRRSRRIVVARCPIGRGRWPGGPEQMSRTGCIRIALSTLLWPDKRSDGSPPTHRARISEMSRCRSPSGVWVCPDCGHRQGEDGSHDSRGCCAAISRHTQQHAGPTGPCQAGRDRQRPMPPEPNARGRRASLSRRHSQISVPGIGGTKRSGASGGRASVRGLPGAHPAARRPRSRRWEQLTSGPLICAICNLGVTTSGPWLPSRSTGTVPCNFWAIAQRLSRCPTTVPQLPGSDMAFALKKACE